MALPFVLRQLGVGDTQAVTLPKGVAADRLIVVTPHNEQIRSEMAAGFNRWRKVAALGPVEFDWRASGGTTDLRRSILAQFTALGQGGRSLDEGIGLDLFFGGGTYDHEKVAAGVRLGDVMEPVAMAPDLPEGLLGQVFPKATLGGERLMHPDHLWIGTALSSFGIVYNRDVLVMLKTDAPQTWSDLADPVYAHWLAAADPSHSGSIAAAFNTVLRRQGWTEGWDTLRRVFANARYFSSSATRVPVDVSAGEAAAGMCIDFYGRTQAQAVRSDGWSGDVDRTGMSRLGYIDPQVNGASMTATTADPITLLRGAPHRDLAEQFIAWLLSQEGQRLWQAAPGTPGGPQREALRRQPIRRDLYTPVGRAGWTDAQLDPFVTAVDFPQGTPDYFGFVAPVTHAMAIDVHDDLVAAWAALQATPVTHPQYADMQRLFDAMPEALTPAWPDTELAADHVAVLADSQHPRHDEAVGVLQVMIHALATRKADQKLRDAQQWTRFFQNNYRQVVALGAL